MGERRDIYCGERRNANRESRLTIVESSTAIYTNDSQRHRRAQVALKCSVVTFDLAMKNAFVYIVRGIVITREGGC